MKKRLFSIVLAALFVITAVPIAVVADNSDIEVDFNDRYTTRFTVETVKVGNNDETVEVDIELTANSGFAGMTYQLVYDSDVLTLEQQPKTGDIEGFEFGPIDNAGQHTGQFSSADNIYDTGVILTYTFRINPEAKSGLHEIKLTVLEMLDENLASVTNDAVSGGVVIPGYMVYYDANYGNNAPDSQYKPKNESVYLSTVTPSRSGYNFLGWAASKTATEAEYQPGDPYSENANLTLYAVWEERTNVAGSIDVEISSAVGRIGGEVEVTISLANHNGFGGMSFDVLYDNTKLDYISCEKKMSFDGFFIASDANRYENKVNFQILAEANVTETGDLVTLKFEVLEEAQEGVTEISIANTDFFVYSGENNEEFTLEPNVTGGSVEIKGGLIGDLNDDGKVNPLDCSILERHLAGWDGYEEETFNYASADVNGDGRVNPLDCSVLERHLAGWSGYETLPYEG